VTIWLLRGITRRILRDRSERGKRFVIGRGDAMIQYWFYLYKRNKNPFIQSNRVVYNTVFGSFAGTCRLSTHANWCLCMCVCCVISTNMYVCIVSETCHKRVFLSIRSKWDAHISRCDHTSAHRSIHDSNSRYSFRMRWEE